MVQFAFLELRNLRIDGVPVAGEMCCLGTLDALVMSGMERSEEILVLGACRAARSVSMRGGAGVLDAMPERLRPYIVELDPGLLADDFAARHLQALPGLERLFVPVVVDDTVLDQMPGGVTHLILRGYTTFGPVGERLGDRAWAPRLRSVEVVVVTGEADEDASMAAHRQALRMDTLRELELLRPICRERGIFCGIY